MVAKATVDATGQSDLMLASGDTKGNDDIKCTSSAEFRIASSTTYTRKLSLHIFTCFFVAAHVVANASYLCVKFKLYANNFSELLAAPWLILVLSLELIYFASTLVAAMDNFLPPGHHPELQLDGHFYPTVHILLPCCKEPIDVLEETIRAALKMNYPGDRFKVLVLDDGGDDDLRAFCETLAVEAGGQIAYLRRIKIPGLPHHFKCGNVNHGLQHSDSEYVVVMDADMILHPAFLARLLPHIVNSPNVAFVQIPQSFYNLPRGDPLNDSSILGYDKVLVHRDSLGCSTCIGTGAIFRRKHLDIIGGFQPHSITEDTTTSYFLFKEGYRSVYLNEKLQIGLTPWTLEGYIRQRCRWGQGAMQQFRATRKAMLGKNSKLHVVMKVLFVWNTAFYFLSLANLIMVTTMICSLIFRLEFSVGSIEGNRQLIKYLAYNVIFWRLAWLCVWMQVPQSIQSRNRDESSFWWMTPFFCKMIMDTIFAYKSTFKFVPTSTVDRKAAKGKAKHSSPWKLVRFHLVYTFVIITVVIARVYVRLERYPLDDCRESFFVFGLSLFLLTTCAHMMLPVLYILWPSNVNPSDRKSLLRYDADGVPVFNAEDCVPKWVWSVMLYELLSYATLAIWVWVVWMVKSGVDRKWCSYGRRVHDDGFRELLS